MICEQQKLFNSLDKDQRYKHTMEWEDITYRGFCNALEHPELYTWPMPDFVFQVEHVLHNGTFCTFVACNCDEPCEVRMEMT